MMDCLCFRPRNKQSVSTSALLTAAKEGNVDAVVTAVKAKPRAAYYAQSWGGGTVWHLAARHGQADVLLGLLSVLAQLPATQLQQHLGQLGNDYASISLALMEDADGKGLTPLHLASVYGHVHVISLLMERKVNPFAQDVLGRTPLHYAASLGRVSCIRAMLEGWAGHQARWVLPPPNKPTTALVDAATPAGCTPLHYAVWGDHKVVIQALLSYDARLDVATVAGEAQWVQVGAGFTPLHVAAVKGDYDIVKLLLAGHVQGLAAGAEVMQATHGQWGARHTGDPRHLRTARGMMAYHLALGAGHAALAELLHPDIPYTFIFSNDDLQDGSVRTFGPPRLMVIAAGALQRKLLCELEAVKKAAAAAAEPIPMAAAAPQQPASTHDPPSRPVPLTAFQLASQQKQASLPLQHPLRRSNSHPLDAAAATDQQQQVAGDIWCAASAAAGSSGSCSSRGGKPPLPPPAPQPLQPAAVGSISRDGSRGSSPAPPPPEAKAAISHQAAAEDSRSSGVGAGGPVAVNGAGEEGVVSPFAAESQRRWSISSWGNMSWFSGSSSRPRTSSLQPPGGGSAGDAGRAASGGSSMQAGGGVEGPQSERGAALGCAASASSSQQLTGNHSTASSTPVQAAATDAAAAVATGLTAAAAAGAATQLHSQPSGMAAEGQQQAATSSASVVSGHPPLQVTSAAPCGCVVGSTPVAATTSSTAAGAAAASRHERPESVSWFPWQLTANGPLTSSADFDPSTRSVMSESRLAARSPLFSARSLQRRAPRWTASTSDLLSTRSLATLSGTGEAEGGSRRGADGRRLHRSVSLGLNPAEQASRRWLRRGSSVSGLSEEEGAGRAAAPRSATGPGPAPVEPLERLLSRRAAASGGDPEFKEAVRLLKLASGVVRSPSMAALSFTSPTPSEVAPRSTTPSGMLRTRSRVADRPPSTQPWQVSPPGALPDASAGPAAPSSTARAPVAAAAAAGPAGQGPASSSVLMPPSYSSAYVEVSPADAPTPWLEEAASAAAAVEVAAGGYPGAALPSLGRKEGAAAPAGAACSSVGGGLPTIYSRTCSSSAHEQPGTAPAGEESVEGAGAAATADSCWEAEDGKDDDDEDEEEEEGCEVCFDAPDVVALQHCGHRLCTTCAAAMCKLHHFKPALCPFCRQIIGGLRLAGTCP